MLSVERKLFRPGTNCNSNSLSGSGSTFCDSIDCSSDNIVAVAVAMSNAIGRAGGDFVMEAVVAMVTRAGGWDYSPF